MHNTTVHPSQIIISQCRLAMCALMITVTLASLDTTITNTALPNIVRDLNANEASVIWIANSYQIAMIASLLSFSALGESIGYRKIHISGLILFCIASLICGLSESLSYLILGRVLQGVGAAAIMSVSTAFIRHIYPSQQLGKGLSLNAFIVAVGFALGPLCASIILSFTTWHWLFLFNLPIGLCALILSHAYLPTVKGKGLHFDLFSSMLCTLFLGFFTFSLCFIENQGNLIVVLISFVISITCLIVLLKSQRNHLAPILAIDLLKIPVIFLSSLTSICAFATQALALISLPFLFQNTFNISLITTGLLLTAWPIAVALVAIVVSPLSDRLSAGVLSSIGLIILSLSMFLLQTLPPSCEYSLIILYLSLCGLGFGLFQAPNMKAIMGNAPSHRSGGASGVIAISRLMGQTCGAALVAQCFHLWNQEAPEMALFLGSICASLGGVFSLFRLKKTKK